MLTQGASVRLTDNNFSAYCCATYMRHTALLYTTDQPSAAHVCDQGLSARYDQLL
jgi:hypothetical protein